MFEYDKNKALLYIYSGAGGVDAQDWAGMLLKMYQRYANRKGWSFHVLHQSFGEQKGIKNAICEISGDDPYGILKGEAGVHRLVRLLMEGNKKVKARRIPREFIPLIESLYKIKI